MRRRRREPRRGCTARCGGARHDCRSDAAKRRLTCHVCDALRSFDRKFVATGFGDGKRVARREEKCGIQRRPPRIAERCRATGAPGFGSDPMSARYGHERGNRVEATIGAKGALPGVDNELAALRTEHRPSSGKGRTGRRGGPAGSSPGPNREGFIHGAHVPGGTLGGGGLLGAGVDASCRSADENRNYSAPIRSCSVCLRAGNHVLVLLAYPRSASAQIRRSTQCRLARCICCCVRLRRL